eukprot:s1236_g1.t1
MAISTSLLLPLAALTSFRIPLTAAELCGNSDFDLDTCVSTEEPCGQLPANKDHLTLVGYNTELECVVADLDSANWGICKSGNLTQSHGCTPSNATKRPTEFYIVLGCALVVHVVLLGLVLTSSSESGKTQKLQSGVFWWCHFWASLLANVFVTWTTIAWGAVSRASEAELHNVHDTVPWHETARCFRLFNTLNRLCNAHIALLALLLIAYENQVATSTVDFGRA